ncbi:DUF6443 domain-containing protein, partial [Alistipes sp. OttesenSCG-928-B03]|nr:DUF6443 domain-containing protein [Alistipes sp. OttesenSCG-928-B03]
MKKLILPIIILACFQVITLNGQQIWLDIFDHISIPTTTLEIYDISKDYSGPEYAHIDPDDWYLYEDGDYLFALNNLENYDCQTSLRESFVYLAYDRFYLAGASKETILNTVNSYFQQEGLTWISAVDITIVNNSTMGYIRLNISENTTGSSRYVEFISSESCYIIQESKDVFNVSGPTHVSGAFHPWEEVTISLSGSEPGPSYALVKSNGNKWVAVTAQQGTGSRLSYKVAPTTTPTGYTTYSVRREDYWDVYSSSWWPETMMNGKYSVYLHNIYNSACVDIWGTCYLDPMGDSINFQIRTAEANVKTIQQLFEKYCETGYGSWDGHFKIYILDIEPSPYQIYFEDEMVIHAKLQAAPNLQSYEKESRWHLKSIERNLPLNIIQQAGGSLMQFELKHEIDYNITSCYIYLEDSQAGVEYVLYKDGQPYYAPDQPDILYSITSTGGKVYFDHVFDHGVYTVKGFYEGQCVEMAERIYFMYGASIDSNYIKTRSYRNASMSQYTESATHYDGLGRPIQTVNVSAGGNGNDIIQIVEYDNMGRNDAKGYLPYSRQNLGYKMSAGAAFVQDEYYSTKLADDPDSDYPFSRTEYNGMTVKTYGPGSSGANHPALKESYLNDGSEVISKYVMASNGTSIKCSGIYASGKLSIQKTSKLNLPSDQQVESYTYTNSSGQVVAEETRAGTTMTDRRITYYVYDDMGKQRYIIPPIQSELLPTTTNTETPLTELRKYCYYNEYDDHGRLIKQYVPGAEPSSVIYDKRGRVVMTQDGRQSATDVNQWAFTKYD